MKLGTLSEGIFLKRYKRFFVDVRLRNGEEVTAHLPNTGSLKTCLFPSSPCRVSFSKDPKRKLPYTFEMIKAQGSWVGVNTLIPNKLAWEAWEKKKIKDWKRFQKAFREVRLNLKTRIDLAFSEEATDIKKVTFQDLERMKFHFVEIKNVTMKEGDRAFFPDAVTKRGQKHIQTLCEFIKKGHSAELLFVVQRQDCKSFSIASKIDPEYGKLIQEARKKGLTIRVHSCLVKKSEISLDKPLRYL